MALRLHVVGLVFRLNLTPAMVVAGGLLVGDSAAYLGPTTLPWWALVVAAGGVLVLSRAPPPLPVLAIATTAFFVGFVRASATYAPRQFPPGHIALLPLPDSYEIEARIKSGNLVAGVKSSLVADVLRVRRRGTWQRAVGTIRIVVYRCAHTWPEGTKFRAFLKLRRPRNFGNRNEFNYVAYLARQGIYVTASSDSDQRWQVLTARRSNVFGAFPAWRLRVNALFTDYASPSAAAVLRALVLGDQSGISQELREAFSKLGVGHVLSISGLHVALVAGAGYVTARFLLSRSERLLLHATVPKLAAVLSLVPVVLYAAIAGESVATRRALLMLAAFVGGLISNREGHFLNVLALAAIVVVLFSPGVSGDVSFQLSFVAVWALARATHAFQAWWPASHVDRPTPLRAKWQQRALAVLRYLLASLWFSLAAVAATAPFTAWHFYQIPLIAPLANLCLVPLLGSLAVLLGLAVAFTEPLCRPLAAVCAYAAGKVVDWGCALMQRMCRLPWVALQGVTLDHVQLFSSLVILWAIAHTRGRARAVLLGGAAILAMTEPLLSYGLPLASEQFAIRVLSIGQANAVHLQFPDGTHWLVDGGGLGDGSFDVGSKVVAPALWQHGAKELEAIVLTHPQFDHFGGLAPLVTMFQPHAFYHNGVFGSGWSYQRLRQVLHSRGISPISLYQGAERCVAGVGVSVWHPPYPSGSPNPNHDSLVLLLQYAGRTVLLPGDIEAEQERQLLDSKDFGPIDILVVPHHGSRTSSSAAFVSALRPRFAVVSAGWQNRFRFPHAEVCRRYANIGSTLLRTDWDGSVEFAIHADGTLTWRTTLPPWNHWHSEPLDGPIHSSKFVDSPCGQG